MTSSTEVEEFEGSLGGIFLTGGGVSFNAPELLVFLSGGGAVVLAGPGGAVVTVFFLTPPSK